MKLEPKRILYFIFNISLKLFTILLPIVLMFVGCLFINLEILHYFQRELGIFDIESQPLSTLLGIFLFILAILSIYLTVKTKSTYYFAIFSLILNGLFIFVILLFLITPALDFFTARIMFQKGLCVFLNKVVEINNYQEDKKVEAKNTVEDFCLSASKIFYFKYPQ